MIPSSVRIFVARQPQDMRRSFDTLALAAKQVLGEDPQSGALFCFVGHRANRLKILWWDRNGYCLLYKRLHRAVFRMPTGGAASGASTTKIQIDARELATLLAGIASERSLRKSA